MPNHAIAVPADASAQRGAREDRPAILRRRRASMDEWRTAFEGSAAPGTTFFHGPLWSEIWAAYSDGAFAPDPRLVEFDDGVTAVIGATSERRRGGMKRTHLSPCGTYGGWVSSGHLTDAHHEMLAEEILRDASLIWRRTPASPGASGEDGGECTHVIDLTSGAEAAQSRWRAPARRAVGRARREGAVVREGETLDDWLAYHRVYQATMAHWERPTSSYREELFRILHGTGSDLVRLRVVELDGEVVAGGIFLTSGSYAVHWAGAAIRSVPGATNLLLWDVLELLANDGYAVCDLNPSGGHSGVAAFKEAIGGVPVPAPLTIRRDWFERGVAVARNATTKVPRRRSAPE